MSTTQLLYDGRLRLRIDLAACKPPPDAILLAPAGDDVAIVTTLAADRGWLYQQPEDLLRAVHRLQWLEKRGPVYYRPYSDGNFYKADLGQPRR